MYIETSYPRKKGDIARFISPTYAPVKGGQCFQFWYHMYGQDIGTLNVYMQIGQNLGIPVWTRSGNRGNVWKVTQVSITTSSSFNVCALYFICFKFNSFVFFFSIITQKECFIIYTTMVIYMYDLQDANNIKLTIKLLHLVQQFN